MISLNVLLKTYKVNLMKNNSSVINYFITATIVLTGIYFIYSETTKGRKTFVCSYDRQLRDVETTFECRYAY